MNGFRDVTAEAPTLDEAEDAANLPTGPGPVPEGGGPGPVPEVEVPRAAAIDGSGVPVGMDEEDEQQLAEVEPEVEQASSRRGSNSPVEPVGVPSPQREPSYGPA